MRPGWLAWAAFYFGRLGYGFSWVRTDHATPVIPPTPPYSYLKIRFLFSYTSVLSQKYMDIEM